ncbi:hypothetical protein [Muricoccus pecuniae]|uniref:HEPN domain-containing protein n=1 Tax=Muricoccus pecuniae TaxID=693023 RepID=A0A840YBK0_9PROT|nr:hypothetical protein [Roseomonas pecuniae]MBB5693737.1 hypothetical protein [Roseomonas pecuniae]
MAGRLLQFWASGRAVLPLFFLCSHSIELSIKSAIRECAEVLGETPDIAGHSLARLWNWS